MTMRTTLGTAQQLHLSRAARTAGEAFAFDEPEILEPSRTRLPITVFLAGLAAVALTALYMIAG
ncbi:hypothetical protein [Microvirga rosea]|uniref:hypothetical protein n=1 Tax=Microvirga rosea TaxID=2715425 RepID=UPI001D0B9138|nr:hypothetical protein [Microvirga rosea]MCB8821003.1 hypothetical protein [Microvirga rosea]